MFQGPKMIQIQKLYLNTGELVRIRSVYKRSANIELVCPTAGH